MLLMIIKFFLYTYVFVLSLLALPSKPQTVTTFLPYDLRGQELQVSRYNALRGIKSLESNEMIIIENNNDDGLEGTIDYEKVNIENNDQQRDDTKVEKDFEPIFLNQDINEEVAKRIKGISWREEAPVTLDDLAYLQMSYWGYDDMPHVGEMIVHQSVADEVLDIFTILYKNHYPIEKMKLIDEYNANDDLSMKDNNTSAFCYRTMTNSDFISMHSYGMAIDINPLVNPYVSGEYVSPEEGAPYKYRDVDQKGMIKKGDLLYQAFTEREWIWGGDWDDPIDYQHFEKSMK